jgi:hypothetical protein
MENASINFTSSGNSEDNGCSSWRYSLTFKKNNTFHLDYHIRSWWGPGDSGWSDAAVNDFTYDGDYSVKNNQNGTYDIAFSNITKGGQSQAEGDWTGPKPISSTPYTGTMSGLLNDDGSLKFTHDGSVDIMKSENSNLVRNFFKLPKKDIDNIENINFEASGQDEGSGGCSSWRYSLTFKNNHTFKLDFHLRTWYGPGDIGWSDAAVDDFVYNGDFSVKDNQDGTYEIIFKNIFKGGQRQAEGDYSGAKSIGTTPYAKNLFGRVNNDGSLKFTKDNWVTIMKCGSNNVRDFLLQL